MALFPVASLPWLILHDIKVRARGREKPWGRRIAIALVSLFPIFFGIGLAWQVRAAPAMPERFIGEVSAGLLVVLLVMTSSAFAQLLRLGRNRGELELLLTAPVPVARVVAARTASVQALVVLPLFALTLPFFIAAAVLGHPGWLAGPFVMLAIGLVGTALALALLGLMERLFGPRLARTLSHVMGVVLAASVFALGQAPNLAPRWFEAQIKWLETPPPAPLDWPARAMFGDWLALVPVMALAALSALAAVRMAAARLEAAPPPTADHAPGARGPRARFGGGAFAMLFGKELRLLIRDPELITQVGQQLVFMVPVLALIFTGGRITPERMAAAGVFLGGALSSSLAWLVICAEDSPDLIATAPLRRGLATAAKLAAALTPPLIMVMALALAVSWRQPLTAALMLPMALLAGLATAAMQAWVQPPARRSAFRQRYRSSFLMAIGEFVMLGSLALAVPALLLAGVWLFRIKPAE